MQNVLLILPDFLIILLGAALGRWMRLPEHFWQGIEKLVYYVLFPVLLFQSVAASRFVLAEASLFLTTGIVMMLGAVVLSGLCFFLGEGDRPAQASAFQCNFRFNSYVGFAVTLGMFGREGFALLALFTAFWVPISSSIAVSALARATAGQGATFSSVGREIMTNPLIIATLAGLLYHSLGATIDPTVGALMSRLGGASLALGLLAIGAALRFEAVAHFRRLVCFSVLARLLAVPVLCIACALYFGLDPVSSGVLLVFASLPTANSCYILAVRMGGSGPLVAAVTTAQTLLAMVTMPLWLTWGQTILGY